MLLDTMQSIHSQIQHGRRISDLFTDGYQQYNTWEDMGQSELPEIRVRPQPDTGGSEDEKAYFVVYAAPPGPSNILGVHHCTWSVLKAVLPPCGTSDEKRCKDLRPFHTLEHALKHYRQHNSSTERITLFRYWRVISSTS